MTTETQQFCDEHNPCPDARAYLLKHKTGAKAWSKCQRGDWMIYALRKAGKLDKPTAVRIAIKCAEHVLPLYEKRHSDKRPRQAIEAAQAWLEDQTEENARKARAYAAYAAAAAAAAYAAAAAEAAAAADARLKEYQWQADMQRKLLGNPFKGAV